MDMHIPGRNLQSLGKLSRQAGDVLRGDAREKMIVIGPFRNRSVAFQAAMGDDPAPVNSLGSYLRLLESIVRLPFYLFTLFLVRRSSRRRLLHGSPLQAFDPIFPNFAFPQPGGQLVGDFERNPL